MKWRFWLKQLLPLIGLFAVIMLTFPNCGKNSKSARRARDLNQERLAEIFNQMERLLSIPYPEDSLPFTYSTTNKLHRIPTEFADLDCKVVSPYAHPPYIRLGGCFDEAVDLVFYGLHGDSIFGQERPRIILEFKGSMVPAEELWSQESKN